MKKSTLAIAALVALFSNVSFSATHTVTSAADDGEGTLRALFNSAASGDEILIPEGMEVLISSVMARTNATLTVRGLGKGATINGQGITPAFYFRTTWGQVHTLAFESLTFTNCCGATGGVIKSDGGSTQGTNHYRADRCRFVGNSATSSGGVLNNGSDWVITDCVFEHNSAPTGAVCPAMGATMYITNSVFRFNTANKGAVFGDTAAYPQPGGNLYADHCDFSCNSATNGGGGFAIKVFKNMDVRNCTFTNNTSSGGYAVCGQTASNSTTVNFEDCVFDRNTAGGEGGVFGLRTSAANPITIRRCKISNNTAARISLGADTDQYILFENCLLEGNVSTTGANWYSAGMFGFNQKKPNLTFTDCVFRGNGNNGGGEGSLAWFYSAGTNALLKIKGSLFEGNWSKSTGSAIVSGAGFRLEIDDCTFLDNGISPDGVQTNKYLINIGTCTASRHVRNCTFVGNWGTGTAWQKYGLVMCGYTSTLDSDNTPQTFLDIDHCTFVSNHMLKVSNSTPSILYNEAASSGLRISNCAFADNFNSAGADMAIAEKTAGTTSIRNCRLTSTTTATDISGVTQSLAVSAFRFEGFGDNGITTTLYGNEKLPTLAIASGSCLKDAGAGSLAFDARGFARDAHPDIGAYERIVPPGSTIIVR